MRDIALSSAVPLGGQCNGCEGVRPTTAGWRPNPNCKPNSPIIGKVSRVDGRSLTNCVPAGGCAGTDYPFLTLKERDVETELDYFLARYYSPTQGRFISPDIPLIDQNPGDPQSWNLYTYVRNAPLTHTDPNGRQKQGYEDVIEKFHNFLWYHYYESNVHIMLRAETYRNWLSTYWYVRDSQGRWHHYDASNLSDYEAIRQYEIIQEERAQGRVYELTVEEAVSALGGGRPALKDDPYHPDSVTQRQNTELTRLRERMQSVGREAERLGFNRRIASQKAPFNSHGQDVFTDGRRFITRDVDSHSGGVWKMFDSAGRRLGTYDANLNRIGP